METIPQKLPYRFEIPQKSGTIKIGYNAHGLRLQSIFAGADGESIESH